MGLRVQPVATNNGGTAMNYNRVTALDKWKTDWFHEISNLFTVTTDQVIGCNESQAAAMHEADSTSKYHSRMLQNRAKLNMVVSMVERYVKGALSVEHPSANLLTTLPGKEYDINSNITPWTMVSPDEVCPVDRSNTGKRIFDKSNLKKCFTVDEALETLSQDSGDFEPDEMNNTNNISTPNDTTTMDEDKCEDLLAQACEIINKQGNDKDVISKDEDIKSAFTDRSPSPPLGPESPDSVPTIQLGNTKPLPSINKFTRVQPVLNSSRTVHPASAKSLKLLNGKDLQSMMASGGKFVILTSENGKIKADTTTNISTVRQVTAKQTKFVEIVPATLPDGRVIHLEVMRHLPQPRPIKVGVHKPGVKHVILPQSTNGRTQKRSLGKIIPVQKYNTALASHIVEGGKLIPTNSLSSNTKTTANTPMVYLKRPSREIVFAGNDNNILRQGKTIQISPAPPEILNNIQQSGAQILLQKVTPISTMATSKVLNVRKRMHDGNVKSGTITRDLDVNQIEIKKEIENEAFPSKQESDILNREKDRPEENDKEHISEENIEEELNVSLLNEFMDQLPPPGDGDEDLGALCHGDILDDLFRESSDVDSVTTMQLPDQVVETTSTTNYTTTENTFQTTQVPQFSPQVQSSASSTTNSRANQPSLRGGSRNVSGAPLSYTLPTISAVHPVLQSVESMIRKRNASNENRKRKALASIENNSRNEDALPKPKRKYTKRVEVKESSDERSSITILGPTAAAAAKNPYHKPPLPYNILIYLAFKDAEFRCLTVKQIYNFVLKTFPYFTEAHQTWQNAIRHQLCCCKIYQKVPLVDVENGVEKATARSAWKISNEESITKLEYDSASTIIKRDTLEKIKLSLGNPEQFPTLFGNILAAADEQNLKINDNTKSMQSFWQSNPEFCNITNTAASDNGTNYYSKQNQNPIQKATKFENMEPHLINSVEISPPTSCESSTGDDEDLAPYNDFPLFDNLADSDNLPFVDILPRTVPDFNII